MRGRVFEIELTAPIHPIWGVEKYDWLWILLRHQSQPLCWISINNPHRQARVSQSTLQQAILDQVGWHLAPRLFDCQYGGESNGRTGCVAISVVVCTRDRADMLSDCLQALTSMEYPAYEIIVVDNASSNQDTARLVRSYPVRYVREPRPGLDWARNCGIAAASHDLIAFTDDDARPDKKWLRAIASAFADPEVTVVTGMVAPAELETDSQHLFEFGYGGMGKGFRRHRFTQKDTPLKDLLWAHVFGVGANMAFRKKAFQEVGAFDEALDVGTPSGSGGDLEMLHRLVTSGKTVLYDPAALVWHVHRRSPLILRRQLYDNGRGFGAYLITCYRKRTIPTRSILRFVMKEWIGEWLIRRLIRPNGFPRTLVWGELLGALRSPLAYLSAQRRAAVLRRSSATGLDAQIIP